MRALVFISGFAPNQVKLAVSVSADDERIFLLNIRTLRGKSEAERDEEDLGMRRTERETRRAESVLGGGSAPQGVTAQGP